MKSNGTCECGAVTYEVEAEFPDVTICHCGQCQRTSGHAWASVSVPLHAVTIKGQDSLKWYASSDIARRGFCTECGSSLFFERLGKGRIAIGAGTLTQPTGLKTGKHIFLADKGDHYDISCSAPQYDTYE
ncbi:Glutathione-dependent formaldehyde-activating enzyme [Roseovarius albus]|uniref:Glutathione-dependent formaldehyde-activating enzyme n=1 Tax=Roseovarius albus TaxID=1247867 RepID=A0A1X6ZJ24_9RHOB|nr:GFA family protein [Roseovarius albus]SLN53059.1 Glutathione-dependent formaldehyde-activating enzyme [Roseovarius albus]